MLPVAIDRIPFGENKMQFSVSQIAPIFKKVPKDSIGLCMGDVAYSYNKFVQPLYRIDNVQSPEPGEIRQFIKNMSTKKKVLAEKGIMEKRANSMILIVYLPLILQKNLKKFLKMVAHKQ